MQKNQWQTYGDMGPETYQFYEDIHALGQALPHVTHFFFGKIGKFGAHSFMSLHPSIVPKLEMINRAAKHMFWLE